MKVNIYNARYIMNIYSCDLDMEGLWMMNNDIHVFVIQSHDFDTEWKITNGKLWMSIFTRCSFIHIIWISGGDAIHENEQCMLLIWYYCQICVLMKYGIETLILFIVELLILIHLTGYILFACWCWYKKYRICVNVDNENNTAW